MLKRNKSLASVYWVTILIVLSFTGYAHAQSVDKLDARLSDHKLTSKLMAKEMPYRVVLPVGYDVSNETKFYPTLYLLHGLTGHYVDWSKGTKLSEYSKASNFIIVMPEGNNGWYTDSATISNDKYESYIIKELMPEIEKKFRVKKTRENRVIAGLSMGGYGALKFGLKYPEKFAVVGSFSGALRAAEWEGSKLPKWKPLVDSIDSTFGEMGSMTRLENSIFDLLKAATKDEIKALPFVYLDCGTEDGLIVSNRSFVKLLFERKARHEYRQLPGAHNRKFWDAQIQEFLEVTKKFVK